MFYLENISITKISKGILLQKDVWRTSFSVAPLCIADWYPVKTIIVMHTYIICIRNYIIGNKRRPFDENPLSSTFFSWIQNFWIIK